MDEHVFLLTAVATFTTAALLYVRQKNKQKTRKMWSRPWLHRREKGSVLTMLNNELKTEDPAAYKNFLRLTNDQFENLLSLVENDIKSEDTFMRASISARNKLETTLRFFATGESYRSLMYSTRIHETTISRFVPSVCDAIIKHLKPTYLKTPTTEIEWQKIAKEFENIWNFPNCLGALDGRHINFRPPISDGSYYYNYKGNHSIVLLGLVDATYRFTYVNIGVNGRISDGGVFQGSSLATAIKSKNSGINLPPDNTLPGSDKKLPYVIVADDAFPLSQHLMKPYPQRGLTHEERIFNYRLSRARRIVENSFGILANRFRVLLNHVNLSAEKTEKITLACVVLHNFLCTLNNQNYTDGKLNELENLRSVGHQGGNQSTKLARNIRDEYKVYFSSAQGSVHWQEEAVRNCNM